MPSAFKSPKNVLPFLHGKRDPGINTNRDLHPIHFSLCARRLSTRGAAKATSSHLSTFSTFNPVLRIFVLTRSWKKGKKGEAQYRQDGQREKKPAAHIAALSVCLQSIEPRYCVEIERCSRSCSALPPICSSCPPQAS